MSKMKLTIEGDMFEDSDSMKIFMHSMDLYCAVTDARNDIRSRLKYAENVSDDEERFLEQLRDTLYVDGVEL